MPFTPEQLGKIVWSTAAISLVKAPRMALLVNMADAETAKDIVATFDTLMTAPPTEATSLQGMIKAKLEQQGKGAEAEAEFAMVDYLWKTYKPEIKGTQIGMVIDLIPTIQKAMELFQPFANAGAGMGGMGAEAPAADGIAAPNDDIFEDEEN